MSAALLVAGLLAQTAAAPFPCLVAEEHHFDFDQDGRLDTLLVLQRGRGETPVRGIAEALLFQLTRFGAQEVLPGDGWWGSYESDWVESHRGLPAAANLLDSSVVWMQHFGTAGNLLFLYHPSPGGSNFEGLTILAADRRGVRLYHHADEFILHEILPPSRADGRWALSGYEAATASFDCGAAIAWFYNPRLVYRLEATARLDERETERVNRRLFGGYRGPRPRTDWLVIAPPGEPARLGRPGDCPALPE